MLSVSVFNSTTLTEVANLTLGLSVSFFSCFWLSSSEPKPHFLHGTSLNASAFYAAPGLCSI